MVLKIVNSECDDLFIGPNCTVSWWEEHAAPLRAYSIAIAFVYILLFAGFVYVFISRKGTGKNEWNRRNMLIIACCLNFITVIGFIATGLGMESELNTAKGKASFVFFIFFSCCMAEVVKNLSFMLLTSSSTVLEERTRFNLFLNSKTVRYILIPWYLFIANGVVIILILSDYTPLINDRPLALRLTMGMSAIVSLIGAITVYVAMEKLSGMIKKILEGSSGANSTSNPSLVFEMTQIVQRLHRMKLFLLTQTPLIVGLNFFLLFTNVLDNPAVYFGSVALVLWINPLGNAVTLCILWPRKEHPSAKSSKHDTYAGSNRPSYQSKTFIASESI